MDRSLKERTIGAVVLVAFAVLVVPVFLDGPSGDTETVSATVTLPGQNDQPRQQKTIVLERDRTLPVPAPEVASVVSSDASTVADKSAPVVAVVAKAKPADVVLAKPEASEPEAKKAAAPVAKTQSTEVTPKEAPTSRAAEPEKPAAASSTGMWAVQLGSFSNRSNAEKLAADLRNDGFAAFLSQLGTESGELHRVRIGPQENRGAAESVADKLGKSGHKGQVVPHP